MSADVDVTVDVDPADAEALIADLEEAGFVVRAPNARELLARTRVLPFLDRKTELPLDVVFAGPGLEEQFLERARYIELPGGSIPVLSPEDLLVTKILAGRPKDIEDARGVLKEQLDSLDLAQIRSVLDLLEQALDRSDLRPVLEAEVRRLTSGD